MNQAGRAGGCTVGKVLFLQKQRLEAAEGSVSGDTRPDDAPTHHNQIEGLPDEGVEVSVHTAPSCLSP